MFHCQLLIFRGLFHHTTVPFGKLNEIWNHGTDCMNVIIGNKGQCSGDLWSKQEFKQRVLTSTVSKRLDHLQKVQKVSKRLCF